MAHEMFRLNSSALVHCHNIEFEIWSKISQLESEFFVENFLKNKIQILQKQQLDFESINEIKKKNVTEKKNLKNVIFLSLLTSDKITDELILRITNTTRQAREFYFASNNLPLLTKPILLMYTFEKLAELLALTIFDMDNTQKYSHGVTLNKDDPLIAQPKINGLFSIFHDCYTYFPDIYLNSYQFKLQDLLRIDKAKSYRDFSLTTYVNLFEELLKRNDSLNYHLFVKEYSSQSDIEIHELDREFLFTFIISTLARYKVNEWTKIIMAKDSDIILKIQPYLNAIQLTFPNLILNYLFDTKFIFVPFSYFDKEDIERIFDDKLNRSF